MIDQVMVVVVVHCYGYEVAVVALVKYVCCTWVEIYANAATDIIVTHLYLTSYSRCMII